MEDADWEPIGSTQASGRPVDEALLGYQGQQGIDGIFRRQKPDGTYEYVVVETKASTTSSTGGLNNTGDGTQLSTNWIQQRLDSSNLSPGDRQALQTQLDSGNLTTVKAGVTNVSPGANGSNQNTGDITFTTVNRDADGISVSTGDPWSP